MFKLTAPFPPTGDQPVAIKQLASGVQYGEKNQVLLGVTGSGKTFTIANVIQQLQIPTLVISHNKTLAGQLYQEFRDFFPENAVSYFVSYYDYYQPEAYLPATDTYIEKEAQINELIDKLRLKTTTNLLTRKDVVVVASVSCIYNIGSPREYGNFTVELKLGESVDQPERLETRLAKLQYEQSGFDFRRGTFRLRGNRIDVYPAYEDYGYRIELSSQRTVTRLETFDPLTGQSLSKHQVKPDTIVIYPAKHFMTDPTVFSQVEKTIRRDLDKEAAQLREQRKLLEADRLIRRVNYDLEMIKEVGYVSGIENYSRYFEDRRIGDPPYSLLDYFHAAYGNDFLVVIDESHMTVPQLRGMYNGDYARKKILTEFGFRLKAAFDNRPLKFDEFYRTTPRLIYVSATPDQWEISMARRQTGTAVKTNVVEQLIRPTGIVDPEILIRPAQSEIPDLIKEIESRVRQHERVLVTTLTKKTAEDLSAHLKEKQLRSAYLHSDIDTLERSDVLDNLRRNEFDVLVGVNLLREGLDLPEVTLVAILDADKEGFLRSQTALIQTMGRAARNIKGTVILYADQVTRSMRAAIDEINRRRTYQIAYNTKHAIKPRTIAKPIRAKIVEQDEADALINQRRPDHEIVHQLDLINPNALTPFDRKKLVNKLEREMRRQAQELNFELAIKIRDKVREIKS